MALAAMRRRQPTAILLGLSWKAPVAMRRWQLYSRALQLLRFLP